ncbi:MAG: hypothetical protein GY737_26570 [Desulfobacteraceae bacterium]|nr:hypothetical protein [Desulfobacteraceae bacterium]
MTGSQKGLIWIYAVLVFVSIGVALYLKQVVLPAQEQEFSSFLIRLACHQGLNICRGFAEIELQREKLEVAEALGDRELIDAYRKQIEDNRARVRDQLSFYKEILLKLGNFSEKIVNTEFSSYARTLIQDKSFSKVHAARLAASNYKLLAGSRDSVNIDTIRLACKENLVKF